MVSRVNEVVWVDILVPPLKVNRFKKVEADPVWKVNMFAVVPATEPDNIIVVAVFVALIIL